MGSNHHVQRLGEVESAATKRIAEADVLFARAAKRSIPFVTVKQDRVDKLFILLGIRAGSFTELYRVTVPGKQYDRNFFDWLARELGEEFKVKVKGLPKEDSVLLRTDLGKEAVMLPPTRYMYFLSLLERGGQSLTPAEMNVFDLDRTNNILNDLKNACLLEKVEGGRYLPRKIVVGIRSSKNESEAETLMIMIHGIKKNNPELARRVLPEVGKALSIGLHNDQSGFRKYQEAIAAAYTAEVVEVPGSRVASHQLVEEESTVKPTEQVKEVPTEEEPTEGAPVMTNEQVKEVPTEEEPTEKAPSLEALMIQTSNLVAEKQADLEEQFLRKDEQLQRILSSVSSEKQEVSDEIASCEEQLKSLKAKLLLLQGREEEVRAELEKVNRSIEFLDTLRTYQV